MEIHWGRQTGGKHLDHHSWLLFDSYRGDGSAKSETELLSREAIGTIR